MWFTSTEEGKPGFYPVRERNTQQPNSGDSRRFTFHHFFMCTLKITFRVAAEYCRQQFIKTGVCQPDTVTIEVDTTAISENYRDLLIHFAPFAFSGDRVKLDIFVNGTTFEDLVTALAGTVIEDAKRKSQADEKTRDQLRRYIAGEGADTQNVPVYGRSYMYPEAAVNLPEFAEFFAAVSSETERRASVAAAKKETAEKERAAAQAKKDAEEAQAKKDAEEWITKHGSAYLKRLFAEGYEYKRQGLSEWADKHAPEFSDCEEWTGFNGLTDINAPTAAALDALDKTREQYPGHLFSIRYLRAYHSGEVISGLFKTPFGTCAIEARIEKI